MLINWEVNGLANIKSAIKRAKVANKKRLYNRMVMSSMRTQLKHFHTAIEAGDVETAKTIYNTTVSQVDKAASKGVMHKNAANRKKAQLAALLAKAQ